MNELQIWICEENIQRFQAQLYKVRDEERRKLIVRLLEEEREMLRKFTQGDGVAQPSGREQAQGATSGNATITPCQIAESYGKYNRFIDT